MQEALLFVWFQKGNKGNYVTRIEGKIAFDPSNKINSPKLAEVEIIKEEDRYYRLRTIGPAAFLEVAGDGERSSLRLKTALRLFGPYDERRLIQRAGEAAYHFFWSGVEQPDFDSRLNAELHKNTSQRMPRSDGKIFYRSSSSNR
jgi:hypothetical protein